MGGGGGQGCCCLGITGFSYYLLGLYPAEDKCPECQFHCLLRLQKNHISIKNHSIPYRISVMISEHVLSRWFLILLLTGQENTEHTPQRIKLPALDGKKHSSAPTQVACGGLCTAVVTEDGDMFATGCGKYGRLATGSEENHLSFIPVPLPEKVMQVGVKVECFRCSLFCLSVTLILG